MKAAKVKIRTVPIKDARESIRLDIYPPIINPATGKATRFEYTGLFLFSKPRSVPEREHNKETKALAENLRAQRQIEIQAGQFGFLTKKELTEDLLQYFQKLAMKREPNGTGNWHSALKFLKQFFGDAQLINQITLQDCEDFKEYLLNATSQRGENSKLKISSNTASSYFNKLKATLKQAYKDGLVVNDLNRNLAIIKPEDTERQFLSLEELQALVNTECAIPILKKAAIFSAQTGLRFSDIQKLTWSEIQHSKSDGYCIRFRQKKTKGTELLPISEQAFSILGEQGKPEELVFKPLEYSATNNKVLRDWITAAGITKYITFHCFRHTNATLMLSMGVDIYTVSKMLGHRELKTTQIYAKVVDKAKQEAAGKIKLEF